MYNEVFQNSLERETKSARKSIQKKKLITIIFIADLGQLPGTPKKWFHFYL